MEEEQAQWEARMGGRVFGRLRVRTVDEVLSAPARDYLLKGIMSPGEMSLWVGAPKSGKSFLLLHAAYAIAQGRMALGRRVRSVPVLYMAAEGEAGVGKRIAALSARHGKPERFVLITQPIDLLRGDGHLQDAIAAANANKAGLIVIDTLNRAIAGGDENSPEAMGMFIRNVDKLRAETGAHIAVIHHGNKASGGVLARGHSSIMGAADCIIQISRQDDGSRVARITEAKDDADGVAIPFGLEVVELGTDQDGDPITTCLINEEVEAVESTGPRLSGMQETARRILADLIAERGQPLPAGDGFPDGVHGVLEKDWRAAAEARHLSMAETAKDRARSFREAAEGLRNKGMIGAREGWVWLAR